MEPEENPLAEWARHDGRNRHIVHDGLCTFDGEEVPRMCFGCLLVALSSDAHYDREIGPLALRALMNLAELARAHLNDALANVASR